MTKKVTRKNQGLASYYGTEVWWEKLRLVAGEGIHQ